MKPNKLKGYFERALGRPLTQIEVEAMNDAKASTKGKRDAVKAMRAALHLAISRRYTHEILKPSATQDDPMKMVDTGLGVSRKRMVDQESKRLIEARLIPETDADPLNC